MDNPSFFYARQSLFSGDGWYVLAGQSLPVRLELRGGRVLHASSGAEVPLPRIAGRLVAVGVGLPTRPTST